MITYIHKKYFILSLALILAAISCGKDDTQKAHDSLIGSWDVISIVRTITDPQNVNSVQEEATGQLGHYNFTNSTMEYSYIFGGSTETDNQDYTFVVSKENAGFTQVTRYDIEGNKGNYRARYGDETSDAHCDATSMSLERNFQEDSKNITLFFRLNKK